VSEGKAQTGEAGQTLGQTGRSAPTPSLVEADLPVCPEPLRSGSASPARSVLALSLGHGMSDFYPGFLASVLPYLIAKLSLSLTLGGALVSLESFATSLIQPVLGYMSDVRRPRPWAAWGLVMASVLLCLLGFAPNVLAVGVLIVLGGLGVALYHPQGAAMATRVSKGRAGAAMSIFATGGSIGYALGPLVAVFVIEGWGLESLVFLALPGVLTGLLIYRVLQAPLAEQARQRGHVSLRASMAGTGGRLAWLLATMTLRSAALSGVSTMLPIYLQAKGLSLIIGGSAVFLFRLAGGVGVFFGGPLSDRLGRKRVLVASFLLALPFLHLFFNSDGIWRMGSLAMASALLTSSTPVNTVMAQEVTPKTAGIASGLMMGVGWALGSLSVVVIGYSADRVGIEAALPTIALVLVAAGLVLAVLIPYRREPQPALA